MNCLRAIACVFLVSIVLCQSGVSQVLPASTANASPELVGQLTKGLSITPAQATGGAGSLFKLAQSRLSPADFTKVASAVPGMGSFLKAAPSTEGASGLAGLAGSLPGGMGGLASTATAFDKLGLSPQMAQKFVPIMTSFVQSKGGSGVASLLSGALK